MRTQQEENDLTLLVIKANSWMELKSIIKQYAPFVSYAKMTPKEWDADLLLRNMEAIRNRGEFINRITRANGLRAKVAELILGENYGDPWE